MLSVILKYFYPNFSFNKLLILDLIFALFLWFIKQYTLLFIYILICTITVILELILFEIKNITNSFLNETNLNQNNELFILDPKLKYKI